MKRSKNHKFGFTLIELLVVIAIISLLSTVVFASLNSSRERARIASGQQLDSTIAPTVGDRLVGQWLFDDSSQPWIDSSGLLKNGTCSSCPSLVNGYNNTTGAQFNSIETISIGTGNSYFPMNSFSSCVWIKSPGLGAGMSSNGILSITYGVIMGLDGSGGYYTYLDDGASMQSITLTGNLYDNKFHHLCLAYDGTRRFMYVDGKKAYSNIATWLGTTRWPTSPAAIGTNINDAPHKFNGVIDDVRIFSGAISEAGVKELYASKINKQ